MKPRVVVTATVADLVATHNPQWLAAELLLARDQRDREHERHMETLRRALEAEERLTLVYRALADGNPDLAAGVLARAPEVTRRALEHPPNPITKRVLTEIRQEGRGLRLAPNPQLPLPVPVPLPLPAPPEAPT